MVDSCGVVGTQSPDDRCAIRREDGIVYLVKAECRFRLTHAKAESVRTANAIRGWRDV
jgi:hypothetical protein